MTPIPCALETQGVFRARGRENNAETSTDILFAVDRMLQESRARLAGISHLLLLLYFVLSPLEDSHLLRAQRTTGEAALLANAEKQYASGNANSAIAILEQNLPFLTTRKADACLQLARYYSAVVNGGELSHRYARQAVQLAEDQHGRNSPLLVPFLKQLALSILADRHMKTVDQTAAAVETVVRRALTLNVGTVPASGRRKTNGELRLLLGDALFDLRKYDDAYAAGVTALDELRATPRRPSVDQARDYLTVRRFAIWTGRLDEATTYSRRALNLFKNGASAEPCGMARYGRSILDLTLDLSPKTQVGEIVEAIIDDDKRYPPGQCGTAAVFLLEQTADAAIEYGYNDLEATALDRGRLDLDVLRRSVQPADAFGFDLTDAGFNRQYISYLSHSGRMTEADRVTEDVLKNYDSRSPTGALAASSLLVELARDPHGMNDDLAKKLLTVLASAPQTTVTVAAEFAALLVLIRNARVAGDVAAADKYCNAALELYGRVQSSKDVGYSPGLKIGISVELLNLQLARQQQDLVCATARSVLPPAMIPIIAMDGFLSYLGEHSVVEPDSWVSSLAFSPLRQCVQIDAFNLTVSTRGRNMNLIYSLGKTAASDRDPELAKRLAILRSYEKLLPAKALQVRGADSVGPTTASLRSDIERLQSDLKIRAAAQTGTPYFDAAAELAKRLPRDSAFVLFTAFQPLPNVGPAPPQRDVGAYILLPSGELRLFRLGSYSDVSQSMASVRDICAPDQVAQPGPLTSCRTALRALGRFLIDPLAPELHGTSRLFIMPSQEFGFIPFSALIDENARYLIQKATVTMLYSARPQTDRTAQRNNRITVFADPSYSIQRSLSHDAMRRNLSVRSWPSFFSLEYSSLPGTGDEAKAIKEIFPNANLKIGRDATEHELKALVAPEILHLATHGYWLAALPDTRTGRAGSHEGPVPDPRQQLLDGLLMGGLVLAGVEDGRSGESEDGIVSGLEAAALELQGTKLVVLSGCSTAMGRVDKLEGSEGLVQAFLSAGSENVIASIWPLDDHVTAQFMRKFYTHLHDGLTIENALQQAMLEMISTPEITHPLYWAGFQLWARGLVARE
jgi:CHAT domain-containing protein